MHTGGFSGGHYFQSYREILIYNETAKHICFKLCYSDKEMISKYSGINIFCNLFQNEGKLHGGKSVSSTQISD